MVYMSGNYKGVTYQRQESHPVIHASRLDQSQSSIQPEAEDCSNQRKQCADESNHYMAS